MDKHNRAKRWVNLANYLRTVPPTAKAEMFLHLIQAIAKVKHPLVTCTVCQTQLPSYVEAEVSGLAVSRMYPDVKQHLDLCNTDCVAWYLDMLEMTLLEDTGLLPTPKHIPRPDLTFLNRQAKE